MKINSRMPFRGPCHLPSKIIQFYFFEQMEERLHGAVNWLGHDHICTFLAELMLKAGSLAPAFFTQGCCFCAALCSCSL